MTRTRRGCCLVAALLLLTVFPGSTPPAAEIPLDRFGVYDLGGGERIFLVREDGVPIIGLPGGEVRGLFADGEDGYRYGPAMMLEEPVEGRILLGRQGHPDRPVLQWRPAGAARQAVRVAIRREEVRFSNGPVELAGTLYLPPGDPPYPAIVLTHGSGPVVRGPGFYEYYFASLGMAVLDYDKRGTGQSGGGDWHAPFADYARDALAGVEYLAKRNEIRSDRIGIHGPSQGGWIAPLAASMSEKISFVIIRSGNAVSPREQDDYQVAHRFRQRTDLAESDIADALTYLRLRTDHVVTGEKKEEFHAAREAKKKTRWGQYVGDGVPNVAFWRPNADYDPEPALRALRCPVLVLLGEKDKSTSAEVNAPLYERILRESENPDYTVRIIPDANHGMFLTSTGKIMEDEIAELTSLAPGYLETMTEWLRERGLVMTAGE